MAMELKAIHENCSGCGVCRVVCALENFREVNPAKAALRIEGRFPAPGDCNAWRNARMMFYSSTGRWMSPSSAPSAESVPRSVPAKRCY